MKRASFRGARTALVICMTGCCSDGNHRSQGERHYRDIAKVGVADLIKNYWVVTGAGPGSKWSAADSVPSQIVTSSNAVNVSVSAIALEHGRKRTLAGAVKRN